MCACRKGAPQTSNSRARVQNNFARINLPLAHTHKYYIKRTHSKTATKECCNSGRLRVYCREKTAQWSVLQVVHLKVSTLISGLYLTSFGYIDLTSISYICYIVDLYVYTFIFSKSETVKLLMTLRRIPLYDASLYGFVVIFVEPCISVVFEFKSLVHTIITKVLFTY